MLVKLTSLGKLPLWDSICGSLFYDPSYHNCILTTELLSSSLSRCHSQTKPVARLIYPWTAGHLPLINGAQPFTGSDYQLRARNLCEFNALKLIIIIRYMVGAPLSDAAYQVARSLFVYSSRFITRGSSSSDVCEPRWYKWRRYRPCISAACVMRFLSVHAERHF